MPEQQSIWPLNCRLNISWHRLIIEWKSLHWELNAAFEDKQSTELRHHLNYQVIFPYTRPMIFQTFRIMNDIIYTCLHAMSTYFITCFSCSRRYSGRQYLGQFRPTCPIAVQHLLFRREKIPPPFPYPSIGSSSTVPPLFWWLERCDRKASTYLRWRQGHKTLHSNHFYHTFCVNCWYNSSIMILFRYFSMFSIQ